MLVFLQIVITVVNTVQPLFMMEITIIVVMLRRKPHSRPAYAHTTGTGSVTGSQYGGVLRGTSPPGMQTQMRPIPYASSASPGDMSQIQPMIMDPAYGMVQLDMHGLGMYNTAPSHIFGTFDHMGAPTPAFSS